MKAEPEVSHQAGNRIACHVLTGSKANVTKGVNVTTGTPNHVVCTKQIIVSSMTDAPLCIQMSMLLLLFKPSLKPKPYPMPRLKARQNPRPKASPKAKPKLQLKAS